MTAQTPAIARRDDGLPVRLVVNGEHRRVVVEPRTLLVSALREHLGLTGTKVGCDTTNCGACTVWLGGQPVKSCTVLAAQAEGQEVVTIEGLAEPVATSLREAFHEAHGLQCGYCTPGMIMASGGLIRAGATSAEPLDADRVRQGLEGNLCRCTGYQTIVEAVLSADRALREAHRARRGEPGEAPSDLRRPSSEEHDEQQ